MAQSRKYGWLIVILLALTSLANVGIGEFRNPEGQPPPPLRELPDRISGWESEGEIEPAQYVLDILNPDAYVSRNYANADGRKIFLFVQFHGSNRWGAHQPEVCFTSQGWAIDYQNVSSTVAEELPGTNVTANRFIANKGQSKQLVLYWWFASGNFQTASRTAQMLESLKLQIFSGEGGGNGFIEVAMSLRPGQEASDEELLRGFASDLVPLFAEIIDKRSFVDS